MAEKQNLIFSDRTIGVVAVTLSGVGFGFLGIFGKHAYELGLTPGENLALRFLCSAAILWLVLIASKRESIRVPRSTLVACLALGLGGYAIFSSLFFQALKGLSASLTVLLLYTYPVLVSLGAWAFFGDKPSLRTRLCLPLVMVSLALLIWGDFAVFNPLAIGFGLGAAVWYSIYILASSRWLKNTPPLVSVTYIQTFAALGLAALHLGNFARTKELIVMAWPNILGIAIVSTAIPMVLFLEGLKKLKPSEVSMLSTVEPLTAVVLAGLLLGERLSAIQMIGGIGILGILMFVSRAD